MDERTSRAPEAEELRQQLIEELITNEGSDWAEHYQPGSFGGHKLLDGVPSPLAGSALIADMVDRFVLSHPACVQNQEWFALAEQAVAVLHELYQRVGAAHLDEN